MINYSNIIQHLYIKCNIIYKLHIIFIDIILILIYKYNCIYNRFVDNQLKTMKIIGKNNDLIINNAVSTFNFLNHRVLFLFSLLALMIALFLTIFTIMRLN